MFLTYIWQAHGVSSVEAYDSFRRVLENQRELYSHAWGRTPELDIHQQDRLFIGQLRYDTGVTRWRSWVDQGDTGIVWGGICEKYLGFDYRPADVAQLLTTLYDKPKEACSWDGRFCIVTWDKISKKILLTTAATESPSLWYTEGPNGWAVGSRAVPILEMVGGKRAPSLRDISLFLGYGYLIGNGSLFENVRRVTTRQQVLFDGIGKPTIRTYVSLLDCLTPERYSLDRNELIKACGARIVQRVERQLQHSQDPWVLLTGGRDSRCIAAAAQKCGFPGLVHTGGTPDSPDVRIAIEAANRLQLQHQHGYGGEMESPMRALVSAPEYLKTWTRLSEGMETIRHATPFQDFFKRKLPIPAQRRLLFHGLGGESGRADFYRRQTTPSKIFDQKNTGVAEQIIINWSFGEWTPNDKLVREELANICSDFNSEIECNVSAAQWLDLFFWQKTLLHWGEDMMSVKSPMNWHWTPLQDRELIRTYWHLPSAEKITSQFMENVALDIAPVLEGLAYDRILSVQPTVFKSVAAKVLSRARRYATRIPLSKLKNTQSNLRDPYLLQFWELALFGKGPRIWAEFVDESRVRSIMHKNPNSKRLWNMATVELFAMTHCQ